jgi:hypothetical protein
MSTLAAVASGLVVVLGTGGASGAPATSTTLATFAKHGIYSWAVPAGVSSVTLRVFGAAGGNVVNGSTLVAVGGRGGEGVGRFSVAPGQVYEVVVGGRGGDGDTPGTNAVGGFNGGGAGWPAGAQGQLDGAGGGGGSDIRIGGSSNPCVSDLSCGYADRIIVGGGGGGAGGGSNYPGDPRTPGPGGAGGGVSGSGISGDNATGGTQEKAGVCQAGVSPAEDQGSFGAGSNATPADLSFSTQGGGGGGGWYGGGGGCWGGGGGGGSGFVSRFATLGSFPGSTQGGDGRVVISTP